MYSWGHDVDLMVSLICTPRHGAFTCHDYVWTIPGSMHGFSCLFEYNVRPTWNALRVAYYCGLYPAINRNGQDYEIGESGPQIIRLPRRLWSIAGIQGSVDGSSACLWRVCVCS
jgi:hypothetical protein